MVFLIDVESSLVVALLNGSSGNVVKRLKTKKEIVFDLLFADALQTVEGCNLIQ